MLDAGSRHFQLKWGLCFSLTATDVLSRHFSRNHLLLDLVYLIALFPNTLPLLSSHSIGLGGLGTRFRRFKSSRPFFITPTSYSERETEMVPCVDKGHRWMWGILSADTVPLRALLL